MWSKDSDQTGRVSRLVWLFTRDKAKIVIFCHEVAYMYTMRHKFSNFHLIFKMQIGKKMK